MPNTPYGISKLVAEKIHMIWQAKNPESRELTILRPGVVYGKGEHGNFTRLYWGIRKRYFFYTGRRDTIKACIYVKELVRFMKYRMIDNDFKGADIFNCTFEPAFTIEQICETMCRATNMERHIPLVNGKLLMGTAKVVGPLGGKNSDCHHATVVGDTVGDPFKDTSGPSLNILIKLMSMVSIVMAGLTVGFHLL